MKTLIANMKHAIRNNESTIIGGGEFTSDELEAVVKQIEELQSAASLAHEALEWLWGGEPQGTKEIEALQALRSALRNQNT